MANDIKNYWNSKLSKENISGGAEVRAHTTVIEKKKIYRPKPWGFKDSQWLTGLSSSTTVDHFWSGDMQSQHLLLVLHLRTIPCCGGRMPWPWRMKRRQRKGSLAPSILWREFIKSFWLEEQNQ
ncbi:TPA_asm: hypothetical protein HUJ06_032091 [Nelumbo nucifera]|uniref:Uncharacterized protein n=1 Tax=Nelumbo nucifera TaxID=4432 RepID=A0A822ZY70_NELNU|nr:TPA_asm: hypothetical protein HUJ06_032091 [Nelumbo nucifera]